MKPNRFLCFFLCALLLLTACSCASAQPDSADARDALQAYLTEHHGSAFGLEALEVTGSEVASDTVTMTCTAEFTLDSGTQTETFLITFRREGGAWAVQSCRQLKSAADLFQNADATEGADASTLAIPEDALVYNGHSYYVYDDDTIRTWEDAQLFCESLGGYLAVIASEEENTALYEYVKSRGYTQVFFGLSDAGHEGNWKWVKQEQSHYWNWHEGQPNGEEKDNYVQFVDDYADGSNSHTGEWSDSIYGAAHVYVFLCEWPEA